MIAGIRGTLVQRDPTGVVIETGGGVSYFVEVTLGTFERLPAEGQPVRLVTELVVREDAWSLYGFDRGVDRVIFRRLLSASGVGARLALAILSALGSDRAVRAVREKDLAVLASVPGIGRKKAERIALELADRLDDLAMGGDSAVPASSPAADAVRALVGLGFPTSSADSAVRAIAEAEANLDTTTLIRRALAALRSS
ncbi:MAG: Holliday junction branch migration protein RuvA [Gemmatimonadales bacterium]|jgi:Holliday junction DNA helicase RuvA|nr:Holliday junction branch migration protein RuvA [Gemmatimonadales bacterium]MDZ4258243.1 Holliday junction branch migration protein RuvA [Gemmatimonadales bacterium]MDZ4390731.1 Holliday junction branch migration protein RuvA [Gemmatimonadales bacterium]